MTGIIDTTFIQKLDKAELLRLNQAIVNRIRALNDVDARRASLQFAVGDRVKFLDKRIGVWRHGAITKINPKTTSVRTDTGMNWKVSHTLLQKE